jgi:hypothetical protein
MRTTRLDASVGKRSFRKLRLAGLVIAAGSVLALVARLLLDRRSPLPWHANSDARPDAQKPKPGTSDVDVARVVEAARTIPAAKGNYLETDFITNLLATVIDFHTHTTAVERAFEHFQANCFATLRTMDDLQALLAKYSDDKEGNTSLAQYLWGYKMWTRAAMLRGLVAFFDGIGIRDQEALRRWAATAEFKKDFEGRVKGLGPTAFQWLVMRLGVET